MIEVDAAVLGGGISGLTTGFLLQRKGFQVAVLEASGRPGGSILTWRRDGFLFELGPNTVLNNAFEIDLLCDAAGILDRRIAAAPSSKKRYVVKDGNLVALPGGPVAFLTTRLFSWKTKLGLLREPFLGPAPPDCEETIAAFTRRRLGSEFLDYAVGPFVSGVYAGDPEKLSVRHATAKIYALEEKYGSLIRGAIAKRKGPAPAGGLYSFPMGLETLPTVLATSLGKAWLPQSAVRYVWREGDRYHVAADGADGKPLEITARSVACCLPSKAASDALSPLGGDFPAAIADIPYADVAVVCLGFRREQVGHPLDGFGFLAPEVEKRHVLGCLFPSSLFPGRAPEGCVALTAFVGGAIHPERAGVSTDRILDQTLRDLRHLLRLRGEPILSRVEIWRPAIPQYWVGHGSLKASATAFEEANPGGFIGGNLLYGVSMGDCIRNSTALADRMGKVLRSGA